MKWFLTFLLITAVSQSFGQIDRCPIIPAPAGYNLATGDSYLKDKILVDTTHLPANALAFLRKELKAYCGIRIVQDTSKFALQFDRMESKTKDYYLINFEPNNKFITYTSDQSALYAVISFTQMIQGHEGRWFIKHAHVVDAPRFDWRGLHLDVSRHFFTVDEVKRFIDLMALYKFNKFHWHLTDDQGWRIEIKKYPKLTSVGGFRDSTLIGHYTDKPRKYAHKRYGGFYTQDQVREVVEYASRYHIDVVPEIEMPGHSRAAIAAYPELSCTGEQLGVPGLWGIFDDIYCATPETIDFMKNVLTEVIELFPSEYIHIGGDEAPKIRWKESKRCQEIIKENGLKDEHELQSYFITQIDQFLTSKGRKLIGWDEILEGGLSPNAAVMSWRGVKGGIEAAKQKHNVVMSPTTYCYFDYYQSGNSLEPLAIGGYLPLEKVYQFDPIPPGLHGEDVKYVLGGQANLWTEYIPDMKQLEYMTYPRALALSQCVWTIEKPPYEYFLANYLEFHEKYLERRKVNFSKSVHFPKQHIARAKNGITVRYSSTHKDDRFAVFEVVRQNGMKLFNNAFVMGSQDSVFIERTPAKLKKAVGHGVGSERFNGRDNYIFNLHSALGAPIEMLTEPHKKYNHNGSLTLVDGIRRSVKDRETGKWKGDKCLGFQLEEVQFIVDLEDQKQLEALNLYFIESNGSWIYLPESTTIQCSKKNRWFLRKKFRKNVSKQIHHIELNKKARFIRVTIHAMAEIPQGKSGAGHTAWTFLEEIEPIEQ